MSDETVDRTQSLSLAAEQIRTLFEDSRVGISLTTVNGEFLAANKALLRILGYTEAEMMQRTVADFYADPAQRDARAEEFMHTNAVSNYGVQLIRKGGNPFYANLSVNRLLHDDQEVRIALIDDVTEQAEVREQLQREIAKRQRTENELQSQIALVDGLLDVAVETIEIFDANTMEYVRWNRTFRELTGYSDDEIAAMNPVDDFIAEADQPRAVAAVEEILRDEQATARLNQVNKDGSHIPLEYTGAVSRDSDGNPMYIIAVGRDIREHLRAEKALHASSAFVQSSLDALSAHIAILDANGAIAGLNGAWHRFARENQMAWPDHGLERNYLDALDAVNGPDVETARQAAAGIRSVINGDRDYFQLEYACHSPAEQRWFLMRVTRFQQEHEVRVVIAHEDVTERKLGEARLAEVAVYAERTRLARELHDSVTQTLYSLDLFANATQQALAADRTDIVVDHARQIRTLSQHALADMRRLLFELRPPVLEELGIVDALRQRLEMVEARAGLDTEFETNFETNMVQPIPTSIESELYAITLEALNNSLKHGRATRVLLALNYDGRLCSLVVQDDGVGFDVEHVKRGGRQGLRNMYERAEQIDAVLTIQSTPGRGVTIQLETAL